MGLAQIKMPQLGESVTEGTVDHWLKNEGDFVKRDEPLVEVVTDKVNAEIPSPFEGKLVKISAAAGEVVSVGAVIGQIEVEGAVPAAGRGAAEAPTTATAPQTAPAATAAAPPARAAVPASAPATATQQGDVKLSPAVRKLAAEHNIDATAIRGSGLSGRVTREDVLAAIGTGGSAAPPAPVQAPPAQRPQAPAPARVDGAREEIVKLSVMRKSIAEHMVRSLATAPHAWTLQEVDVTNLVRYRDAEKEGFRARHGVALTYLPFVAQVLFSALKLFPWLNSSWTDEGVVLKHYINLGVAVSIPDGLIVPVIRDADRLGFTELVMRLNDVVERARSKQLKPDDVQAGTFTLNNTGATGSIASQPIINQPQAAILTTESIVKRPVVIGEGIAVRHIMNMCLSFDHRIIDGMMAGQFLAHMKQGLEGWSAASLKL